MIRTKMHIKYARLNLQEAEVAIQEEGFSRALEKCRDCAISLVKAIKEAYPREPLSVNPLDLKRLKSLLKDLMDSEDEAETLIDKVKLILTEAEKKDPGRIDAENLLSLTGSVFQVVHDIFAPTLPEL